MARFQVIVNGAGLAKTIDGVAKHLGFVITRIVECDAKDVAEFIALADVRELWNTNEMSFSDGALPSPLRVLEINEILPSDRHEYVSTGFVFYELDKH